MVKSYIEYFEFVESPFKRTPDIHFYFQSKSHKEALDALNGMMNSEDDFAVVTAAPGAGKSILLRKFINTLPPNVIFAYIMFPYLQPQGLFLAVLEDFEVPVDGCVSTNTLYLRLESFLKQQHDEGKEVLLIVDEAQNLPDETLEELRILSNLETDKKKLLKIILTGHSNLKDKLSNPRLNDLKHRITISVELTYFSQGELADYINYSIAQAGGKKITMSKSLATLVWSYTKGNPRLVNMLMDKVLVAMFMDNSKTIRKEHINSAVKSMNTLMEKREKSSGMMPVAAMGLLLAFIVVALYGGYWYLKNRGSTNVVAVNRSVEEPYVAEPEVPAMSEPAVSEPIEAVPPDEPTVTDPSTVEPSEPVLHDPAANEPTVTEPVIAEPVVTEPPVMQPSDPLPITPVTPVAPPFANFGIGNIAVVNSNTLNVRMRPTTASDLIGILPRGTQVTVKDENENWIKIDLNDEQEGWLYKVYLAKPVTEG